MDNCQDSWKIKTRIRSIVEVFWNAWRGPAQDWSGPSTAEFLSSQTFGAEGKNAGDFSFVQISDSHIGFSKDPNKDVTGTLQHAVNRINSLRKAPRICCCTREI